MADGVDITSGAGTKILTDDTGAGGHAQVVKLAVSVDGAATLIPADTINGLVVGGGIAHDGVDSGNPQKIGGKALTATPTPVAHADRVDAWFDVYGRLITSDQDVEIGTTGGVTGLRDRLFAERYTVLADSLADGISGTWTQSVANGGTVTSTVGEGQLKTSTAVNGSAQITSAVVPYYPGQVAWMNSAVRFGDTGVAGNIRRLGMFTVSGTTPQEGFYYELTGTTLNAVVVKAGTPTAVASTSWTRFATAPFTLDANYHSLEIRYTANSVWFYVDNVLRHLVSGTTTALTTTLTLPITVTNVKTSGATDITFAVRNIGNGRFGNPSGAVFETGSSAMGAAGVGGATPHDSVDSGFPVKVGGYASTAAPTAVAAADRVNAWFSLNGALNVVPAPTVSRVRVASSGLTTATTAYTVGDTAGTIMTFAGAARTTGGTGTILSVTLLDKSDVGVDYRLHIYRASVTLAADNVAWAVSDTDQESLIGIVNVPTLADVGANRVATIANLGLPYDCAATSLFVGIETRNANAVYAGGADSLHLILTFGLD